MADRNILVLVPGQDARGGITNYYNSLRPYLPENIIYLTRGARNWPKRNNVFAEFVRMFTDYFSFVRLLLSKHIGLAQTTTSFSSNALWRDSIYILLSKLFRRKIIVFFRGWDDMLVPQMSKLQNRMLLKIYFMSDAFIDLRQQNIDQLKQWGYKKSIYLETTVVDNSLIEFLPDIGSTSEANRSTFNILFLARVEKTKGVYEAVEAYKILKKEIPGCSLTIAGDGSEVENIGKYCIDNLIQDVNFKGFVSGEEKARCYKNAALYIFPSYFEGMPSSVLEAMAFGLPVVTTNVGGLTDFFRNGENGFFVQDNKPEHFAETILTLYNDIMLRSSISKNNRTLANNRFMPEKVAERILEIYNNLV